MALAYAMATHSLIFKIRTDSFMTRGASLRWVSAFPDEDECLFPPLTYLRPTGKPAETVQVVEDGRRITVVEVLPHLGRV